MCKGLENAEDTITFFVVDWSNLWQRIKIGINSVDCSPLCFQKRCFRFFYVEHLLFICIWWSILMNLLQKSFSEKWIYIVKMYVQKNVASLFNYYNVPFFLKVNLENLNFLVFRPISLGFYFLLNIHPYWLLMYHLQKIPILYQKGV